MPVTRMRKNSRNRRSVKRQSYSRNRKLYRSQKMNGGGKKKGKKKGSQKKRKRKGSKKPEQVFGGESLQVERKRLPELEPEVERQPKLVQEQEASVAVMPHTNMGKPAEK